MNTQPSFPTSLQAVFSDNRVIFTAVSDGAIKTRVAKKPSLRSVQRTLDALMGKAVAVQFYEWNRGSSNGEPAGIAEASVWGRGFTQIVHERGERDKGVVNACVEAAVMLVNTINRSSSSDGHRPTLSR
jgi:hypothetical protein